MNVKLGAGIIVLLLLLVGGRYFFSNSEAYDPLGDAPDIFEFSCANCQHEWGSRSLACAAWFPDQMHSSTFAVPCFNCNEVSAYIKTVCPWCKEKYIPTYLVEKHADLPDEDLCPHCGKDTYAWATE